MRIKAGNKEQDILNSAIKVFAEYGYNNSKISKIAELAGVASGSVYLYYKNKDDILLCIFKNIWDGLSSKLEQLVKNDLISPIDKIDGMIDLVFDMFANNMDMGKIFVTEHNNPRIKNELNTYINRFLNLGQEVLKEGEQQGLFTPHLNYKIIRSFIFGGLRHLIHLWADDQTNIPLDQIRLNVKSLIKYGILNKNSYESFSTKNEYTKIYGK